MRFCREREHYVLQSRTNSLCFVSVENERIVLCQLRVRNDILGLGISYDKMSAKEEAGTSLPRQHAP